VLWKLPRKMHVSTWSLLLPNGPIFRRRRWTGDGGRRDVASDEVRHVGDRVPGAEHRGNGGGHERSLLVGLA
jgi:hypothetical protein